MSTETWEYWISHVDSIAELNSDEKEKTKSALKYLRVLFNEDLIHIIEKNHPISHYISKNYAPWTRRWLISLAEAIKTLSSQTNGSKILDKVKDKDNFQEAILHLSVGKCLIDSGFCIEFIQEGNRKTADWKLIDSGTTEQILVELTEIRRPNDMQKKIDSVYSRIVKRISDLSLPINNRPYLIYRGRLFKDYISEPVLVELLRKIDRAAEEARKNGFADLFEANIIFIRFVKEENKSSLKSWSITQKVVDSEQEFQDCADSSFRGPKFQINEIPRIRTRIEEKKRQLDKRNLNILIIRNNNVFSSRNFIHKYIEYLEQFVYDHDYIAMLIIVGGNIRQKMVDNLTIEDSFEMNNHLYFKSTIGQMVRQILIITNNYSMDTKRTCSFSLRVGNALRNCMTLLV